MAGKNELSISAPACLGYANAALEFEIAAIGIIIVKVASCSLWSLLVLS
jgi:hypothetical protein